MTFKTPDEMNTEFLKENLSVDRKTISKSDESALRRTTDETIFLLSDILEKMQKLHDIRTGQFTGDTDASPAVRESAPPAATFNIKEPPATAIPGSTPPATAIPGSAPPAQTVRESETPTAAQRESAPPAQTVRESETPKATRRESVPQKATLRERAPATAALLESRAPSYKSRKQSASSKPRNLVFVIADILFCLILLLVILSIVMENSGDGRPRPFLGYSLFTVSTSDINDEIPEDSLILVKKTDARSLNVGDVITYMRDHSALSTNKITGINENHGNTGLRGFQTKSANETNADPEIVAAANVIGKVVRVMPKTGNVISYLLANIFIVYIILGLYIIITVFLRVIIKKRES